MSQRHQQGLCADQRPDVDQPDVRDEALICRLAERLGPWLRWYFRLQVEGLDHVPRGACLYVGNHNGAMLMPDMFLLGLALHERFGVDGVPWGLAHRLAVRLPVLHRWLARLGGVRGTAANGLRMLREGRKVLVYPGGELDSMRSYRDRHRVIFGHRRGYLRLALQAGVPVVPVVTSGAHETLIVLQNGRWLARQLRLDARFGLHAWPLTLSFPWGLWLGIPPPHLPLRSRVRIAILPPLRFDRSGAAAAQDRDYVEACHAELHGRMEATLQRLARETEWERQRQQP